MTENEKKKSFWTSLPGIFTGIAAVITAVTGLYIAISHQSEQAPPINQQPPPIPAPSPLPPNEWLLVGEDTFTKIPSEWLIGNILDENLARDDLNLVGGKYRWNLEFRTSWERLIEAPYGPATEFYLAVDAKIVSLMSGNITVNLLFGRASKKDYSFRMSANKNFGLSRFDGTKTEMIIDWTPISIKLKESNRMAVSVEDQLIKLYINSELLGTYKDFTFKGGKMGLSVSGQPGVSAVVDFDNFEFWRKP